jgi:hypothetical protein
VNISDEAVEAAAKAICMGPSGISYQQLETALEAAAPYIVAEPKADAWDEGQYAIWGYLANRSNRPRPTNPYRSQA